MPLPPMDAETTDLVRKIAASAGPPARLRAKSSLSLALFLARIAMDVAALTLALKSVYYLRFSFGPILRAIPPPHLQVDQSAFLQDMGPALLMWLFILLSIPALYQEEPLPFEDEVVQVLKAAFLGVIAILAVNFLFHRFGISRLMLLMLFPVSSAFLLLAKRLQRRLGTRLRRWIDGEARVLLIGEGKVCRFLQQQLEQISRATCIHRQTLSLTETVKILSLEKFSEVILTQAGWDRKEVLALADICETMGIELKLVPSLLEYRMGEVQVDRSMAIPTFRFYHSSLSGADFFLKRCFDVAFSSLFFTLFSIPLALICLWIKWDSPGPVFFKQRRIGYKGKPFDLYKFRTMVTNAEQLLKNLRHLNERPGPVFKMKLDPRITRAGRWLRRLSLDEIPQFINVLKGEMSVVGPRPPLPSEVELYDAVSLKRLNVLPGITGLWQVSGRAELDFDQMIALDLYYLEHWSLGLDMKIILKTPAAILTSKGAY